jgi:hypothetical protein
MKIHSNIIVFLLLTAFSLFSISVYAEIIDHKKYTTDTETGLEWLDVTETIEQSYNEVEAQLEPGGKYQGYRFATAEEFNTFIGHYTKTIISQTQVRQVLPVSSNIDHLMNIIGSTQRVGKRVRNAAVSKSDYSEKHWARMLDSVVGITTTGQSHDGYTYIGYSLLAKSQDFGTKIWHYSIASMNKYVDRNKANPEAGSFLVRDTSGIQSLIDQELKTLNSKN